LWHIKTTIMKYEIDYEGLKAYMQGLTSEDFIERTKITKGHSMDDIEFFKKDKSKMQLRNRLKALDSGKYWKFRHKIEKHILKKYFDTKDKTDLNRLGIKFVSPV